jgi:hypothetical protein
MKVDNDDVISDFISARKTDTVAKEGSQVNEIGCEVDIDELLGLSGKVYVDARDRGHVITELNRIRDRLLIESNSLSKSHILYLPEGSGKSRLALDLAARGKKILFTCKSWEQVFAKWEEFSEAAKPLGLEVGFLASKEGKLRKNFKTRSKRHRPTNPYSPGEMDVEATLDVMVETNPSKSKGLLSLTLKQFLSDDRMHLNSEGGRHPLFGEAGNLLDDGGTSSYVGLGADILVTTFAQARILSLKNQWLPRDWLVWFDDPDVNDIVDIEPYDPKRIGELPSEELEKRTRLINRTRYFERDFKQQLGRAYRSRACVYTTTERVTLLAIEHMLKGRREDFVLHDSMSNLAGGDVTILGTVKVQRSYDAFVPLMVRRLEKTGHKLKLIANGLGSSLNHSNSKGLNTLKNQDLLVELSIPHPIECKTVCDALGYDFRNRSREISRLLMLDRMHQAIGRNSGYRHEDSKCVVLTDPKIHKYLVAETRYLVDLNNSVLIDRTAKMSRLDRRTTESAASTIQEIETFLNNLDQYVADKRKIKHDINHVLSGFQDDSKRLSYVARLLTALTSLSGVLFDCEEDYTEPSDVSQRAYWDIGRWVLKDCVGEGMRQGVIEEYLEFVDKPDDEKDREVGTG